MKKAKKNCAFTSGSLGMDFWDDRRRCRIVSERETQSHSFYVSASLLLESFIALSILQAYNMMTLNRLWAQLFSMSVLSVDIFRNSL